MRWQANSGGGWQAAPTHTVIYKLQCGGRMMVSDGHSCGHCGNVNDMTGAAVVAVKSTDYFAVTE